MKKQILKEKHPKTALVNEKIHPKEFFKTGPGIYVWDSFVKNILPKAKATGKPVVMESFDLLEYSFDADIEEALPKKHIFTESEACALITALIKTQAKGEAGFLLTSYCNIFYTPLFVVGVFWDGGEWLVGAWGRDGRRWGAGPRVFSPATDR